MENNKTNKKYDTINLSNRYPKEAMSIVIKLKDRHRSSKWIKKAINKQVLKLLSTYQIENNKPFSKKQIGFIISMTVQISNKFSPTFKKLIFITDKQLENLIINFKPNYKINFSKEDKENYKELDQMEKDLGID